jgi:hypothetical protein
MNVLTEFPPFKLLKLLMGKAFYVASFVRMSQHLLIQHF